MNALSLASRGYLCGYAAPLVNTMSPETDAVRTAPQVTAEHISAPRTVSQATPDMRPSTKPRRRR